jgi:hypothetical protein
MKNILINDKRGKEGGKALIVLVSLLAIIVVAGLVLGLFYVSQSSVQEQEYNEITGCGDNEPYIDNSTFNEYAKSTAVAVTYYYTIEGDTTSALTLTPGSTGTKFSVGDKLKILSSASGYIDQIDEFTITKCGSNRFTNYVYQGDAITLTVLDQNSNVVTNNVAGGAVNLSDGGTANPLNFIVRLDGASDKSTGEIYLTIEGNDSEVDEFSISPKSASAVVKNAKADILDIFVAEGTSPTIRRAFVVGEILDGGQADYNIKATPESGVTMGSTAGGGFIYVNAYAGQWFVDTDGSLQFGWEDSDGTLKYEQVATDYDALIS